jgi:hypothetical protein
MLIYADPDPKDGLLRFLNYLSYLHGAKKLHILTTGP